MASSTPTGFRYPQAGDLPTVEVYLQDLAEDVEEFTSKVGHTHDTLYSAINHNHATLYSPINHTHPTLPNLRIWMYKAAVNFNSSGQATMPHGLGITPLVAFASIDTTGGTGTSLFAGLKVTSSGFTPGAVVLQATAIDGASHTLTCTVHLLVAG